MSYTLVFGVLGGALGCFSNAARKLPLMRRPWEHIAYAGTAAYVGSHISEFKETQKREITKLESARETRTHERNKRLAERASSLTRQ